MDAIWAYREILKENIEYDHFRKNLGYDCDLLDEILDILADTVCSTRNLNKLHARIQNERTGSHLFGVKSA